MCFPDVCRTCLLVIKEDSQRVCIDLELPNEEVISIRNKLLVCCPEVDLRIHSKAILCTNCLEIIDVYNQFICKANRSNEYFMSMLAPMQNANLSANIFVNVKDEIKTENTEFSATDDYSEQSLLKSGISSNDYNHSKTTGSDKIGKYKHCNLNVTSNIEQHVIHVKEKEFKCMECNYTSTRRSNVLRHIRAYIEQENTFKSLNNLHLHNGSDTQEIPFLYSDCRIEQVDVKQYIEDDSFIDIQYDYNFQQNNLKQEKPFKCSQCDYTSTYESNLKQHIHIHTGEKPFLCSQCNHCTSRKSNLKRHLRVHLGEKPFKCTLCNYSSLRKSDVKQHIRIHTGEKPFKCSQCSYSSVQKSNWKRHIAVHKREKPFQCSQCDFSSTYESILKHHIRIHTGEKPYLCSECNYCSLRKNDLKRHMQVHTGEKPFKCTHCSYSSLRMSDLKQHIRIHTGEKPFKCTLCSYSTIRKTDLKQHIRTHTGEKPFKCSQCAYSTAQKSNLRHHIRIHTGEKPFKCIECNFRCIQKNNLIYHMHSHAKNTPLKSSPSKTIDKNVILNSIALVD